MDFLDASGEGTRATVMEEVMLVVPAVFRRDRDMTGVAGVLEAVREARERRERPGGMMEKLEKTKKEVSRLNSGIVICKTDSDRKMELGCEDKRG